ncbi:YegP family protein [Arthrobacter sp. B10-11]|uniref:YegP family protein n=1 Tax=Arthrobacter sp. B10-11 TaxID=3081160 RepID=UPI002953ACD6|nr:DUF1508 domain-containing protein [Arthrobacter sp. B10-11]MDV8147794.1 DUF1508 domain-containing protein [Arthrobacter sp. B10-11]
MAGMFELFAEADASFRFRLTAPDGTVMALSRSFPDKRAAIAGIAAVREYAGMGFITEIPAPKQAPTQAAAQAQAPAALPNRSRLSSAARTFGGRAARRKRQVLVRWRQSLRPRVVTNIPAW